MATQTAHKVQLFDMNLPLLSEGRRTTLLAEAQSMTVHGKVYAAGGENALHTHAKQDHVFFILQGEATFYDHNHQPTVVGPLQGILLPAGAYYYFQSTGDVNLVIFRTGGELDSTQPKMDDRLDIDGNPFPADDPGNKAIPPVETGERFSLK